MPILIVLPAAGKIIGSSNMMLAPRLSCQSIKAVQRKMLGVIHKTLNDAESCWGWRGQFTPGLAERL